MRHPSARPGPHGFTLVEMMVVIAIISLLAAVSLGVSREILKSVYEKQTAVMLEAITSRIAEYTQEYGSTPAGTNTRALLTRLARIQGVRVEDEIGQHFIKPGPVNSGGGRVIDAWGQEVEYHRNGPPDDGSRSIARDHWLVVNKVPLLVSAGADGEFNTADDVMRP